MTCGAQPEKTGFLPYRCGGSQAKLRLYRALAMLRSRGARNFCVRAQRVHVLRTRTNKVQGHKNSDCFSCMHQNG